MSDVENSWGNKSETDAIVTGDVNATIDGIALTDFIKSGSITGIADNTRTTIVSQIYVVGSFHNLVIMSVSGTTQAKYYLRKNTIDIDTRRTSPGRNLQYDFTGAPIALSPGDIVDVQVEHFNTSDVEDFDATIYGYD